MSTEPVGFFRETDHGEPDQPSLREAIGHSLGREKGAVLHYLTHAPGALWYALMVTDVLDETRPYIDSLTLHTDGVYIWPSDYWHYVDLYDCEVPAPFLQHIRSRNYLPPAAADIDVDEAIGLKLEEGP